MSQPNFPQIGPSLYELTMKTGVFSIIMKSRIARLTTSMFDGVRNPLELYKKNNFKMTKSGGRIL